MGLSLKQLSLAMSAFNFDISNSQMFDLVTRWSIEIWDSRMRIGLRCPVKSHQCWYSCFARELLSCEMTKLTRTNGPTSGLRAKGQLPRPILAYIQRRQKLLFSNNFFFLFLPNHQTFLILFVQFVRNKGVVMIFFLQYLPILLMKVQVFFCFKIWDEEKEKVRGAKFSDN